MPSSNAEQQRGVRTLAFGMLAAQGAAFLATPLLTRLYDPSAFGAYAFLLSVIAVGAPVAALRFDVALVLPEDRGEAMTLARLGMLAALGLAIALAFFVWLARPTLLGLEVLDRAAADLLPWLPALLLATGLFQLGCAWHVRERDHGAAARGRAAQGFLTAAAQIVIGLLSPASIGLAIGDLAGRFGAVVTLLKGLLGRIRPAVPIDPVDLIRRYRGFATYSSTTALVNALNGALPVLIVGPTLGLQATGLLLLAQRVAALPGSLLSTAVSQVFAVEFSRAADTGTRTELYRSTIRRLMLFALPAFGAIAILSPFFGLVFGDEWGGAGTVAAALVPFYALQLLSGATIVAMELIRAHRARLVREIVYLIGMLSVLGIATRAGADLVTIAVSISAFGVVFYFFSLRWVGRHLRQGEGQ